MKIRRLEISDNPHLFEIYSFPSVSENTSQLPFLSSDIVAGLFDNPDHYTLVAERESKVVGHITLFLTNKVRDKHCAGIAIAVHPEAQGTGIGKALMLEAINQADNWLNLVRLELEVHSDNLAAKSLYERVGFEVEGTKRLSTFKSGQYIDMHMMSRIRPDYDVERSEDGASGLPMKLHQQYHFRQSENGLLAWDVLKLIELSKDFEVIQVPLSEIRELKETYWFGLGAPPVTEDIAQHAKQIYEADLSYPIILCPEGRVMDGMHRVCKASIESHKTIPAIRFKELHKPDYVGKQPDELPY